MVLLETGDRIRRRCQSVRAGAVGTYVSRRSAAIELPFRNGIVPNLDFVFDDRRSAVINGEQPIQRHRIFHLFQNTHAQRLSRGL